MLRYMSPWGKFHTEITTQINQPVHNTIIITKAKCLIACSVLWGILRAHSVVDKNMGLSKVPPASSRECRSPTSQCLYLGNGGSN